MCRSTYTLLMGSILMTSLCTATETSFRKIPKNILFGAATAAYQVEGAVDVDGKTANIWDILAHHPRSSYLVEDLSNADIAANSYYLYKRDVEMVKDLGLDFYRFSISWNRILPNSFSDLINAKGVEYYNNLIDELLKHNIEPVVTIHHLDLPLDLVNIGGWTNSEIVEWFGNYARVVFKLFGDRVKYWITINEPDIFCFILYTPELSYLCSKIMLLAHARAYHIYNEEFRSVQNGFVILALTTSYFAAETERDVIAADEATDIHWDIYAHPIFSKHGDFPASIKHMIAVKSAAQGYNTSRLPELSTEEIEYIRGTSDFFGLNHYSTYYARKNYSEVYDVPSFLDDIDITLYQSSKWNIGDADFMKSVPWGFYKLLTRIRERYGNPPIFVGENGYSSYSGLDDQDRIQYYKGYINAMLDAIEEGSDVRAYAAWSLMDNFEWTFGYTKKFGLYEVDFEDPNRTRTPRASAYLFKEMMRTRTIDSDYEQKYMDEF